MLTIAIAALALAAQDPVQQDILFEGTGPHRRKITTRSAEAQKYFDQGLNFLYGFNHDEAIRSFQAAARHDSRCAMAYWGLAMANGPHINNTCVPPEREKAAFEASRLARAMTDGCTELERSLIAAAVMRYQQPQPKDRVALDRAYAGAMGKLWVRYPDDADVGAMYAESLMGLQPWDYWTPSGRPKGRIVEITDTIARVIELNPKHPQANHLAIHAWEASPDPERAVAAADRLRTLQPALGHMVHMPSHIDVRTGEWRKAIIANEVAIKADEEYRGRRPRIGFYRLYMSHNRHMLAHAAMMSGQSQKAIAAMDDMVARIPQDALGEMAPILDGYMATPYEVRVRFGKWDEILALPDLPEVFPLSRALRHSARAIAFAAKKDVENALGEERLFLEAKSKLPQTAWMGNNPGSALLGVAEPLVRGEILAAQDQLESAIVELRKAVQAEDQLRYDEPPDWINPTRHPLGAALMAAGKYNEAAEVYRQDLKILPHNGWSLYGLAEAMRKMDKMDEATKLDARFKEAWADADIAITSSCLCLPAKG